MTAQRRATVPISIIGGLVVIAYAAWAAVHILVLNPLAAVPGRSLDEIYFAMSDAGEPMNVGSVLFILGFGVALGVAAASVSIVLRVRPIMATSAPLMLLMLGIPAHFVAGFSPGMSLADAFGISGGSHSVASSALCGQRSRGSGDHRHRRERLGRIPVRTWSRRLNHLDQPRGQAG